MAMVLQLSARYDVKIFTVVFPQSIDRQFPIALHSCSLCGNTATLAAIGVEIRLIVPQNSHAA